jgi:hypothetical protein
MIQTIVMPNQGIPVIIKTRNLGHHSLALKMVTKKVREEVENMTKTEPRNGTTINLIKVHLTIMCMSGKMGLESIPEDDILLGHRNEK